MEILTSLHCVRAKKNAHLLGYCLYLRQIVIFFLNFSEEDYSINFRLTVAGLDLQSHLKINWHNCFRQTHTKETGRRL